MSNDDTITISPIGIVRSAITETRKQSPSGNRGVIVLDREVISGLKGIEKHSHILVLGWLHKASRDVFRVIPRKWHPRGEKKGVFSVLSPVRPNPVAVTICRLIERNDNELVVEDLDMIDGTPIVDIKPYIPTYHIRGGARWARDVQYRILRTLEKEEQIRMIADRIAYMTGDRSEHCVRAAMLYLYLTDRIDPDRWPEVRVTVGRMNSTSMALLHIISAKPDNVIWESSAEAYMVIEHDDLKSSVRFEFIDETARDMSVGSSDSGITDMARWVRIIDDRLDDYREI